MQSLKLNRKQSFSFEYLDYGYNCKAEGELASVHPDVTTQHPDDRADFEIALGKLARQAKELMITYAIHELTLFAENSPESSETSDEE
jgi:hypothetical protein